MTAPRIRVIDGCAHQLERMTTWADEGACPICLTAELGMAKERMKALESACSGLVGLLQLVAGRDDVPADLTQTVTDNHRVRHAEQVLGRKFEFAPTVNARNSPTKPAA